MSVTTASRDVNQLHPAAQTACKLFLAECAKAGVKIFITETYRSQARQKYLYAQGRTRPGQIVTWTLNSNHKSKLAWDIAVSPPASLYDIATLNKAGAIARKLGITWGGDWRPTIDRPHFEVKTTWKAPSGSAVSSSDRVKELQKLLNQVGFNLAVDGSEGPATKNAILVFQGRVGLVKDGSAGPLTLTALKDVIAKNNAAAVPPKKEEDEQLNLNKSERAEIAKIFKKARESGVFSSAEHEKTIIDGTMSMSRLQYLQTIIAGAGINGGKRIK